VNQGPEHNKNLEDRIVNILQSGLFYVLSVSVLLSNAAIAGPYDRQKPLTLDDYRIVQFISSPGRYPINVMRLDNNGDVLLACREGKTKKQLEEMNIPVNDSQIHLLEVYDLLSVEDDVLKTSIPVLDREQIGAIRSNTKTAAVKLADAVKDDVTRIVNLLVASGRQNNAYSILFAYIVDGMIWSDFRNMDLSVPREINAEHPFWAGAVWAFYPPREYSCGTNTWTKGRFLFVMNWTGSANDRLGVFYRAMRELDDDAFIHFMKEGYTRDAPVIEAFAPFGIFDESGKLLIPTIVQNENNELHRMSRGISKKIAENTQRLLDLKKLQVDYGFRDIRETVVVVYHELMWDLMDEFVARDIIEKPVLFADPENAALTSIADIMFVVHREETH